MLPQFRASTTPPGLSLDAQNITLLQAKPRLVLVEKALEGLDVHSMVHIHHLLGWLLNFWHSDGLANYNKTLERTLD